MKKSLRFLTLLLALILCLPLYACEKTKEDETTLESTVFEFESIDENSYKVSKYIGEETAVQIPSTYKGKAVISIADFAFTDRTNIESIIIPNSITTIGYGAFKNCSSLANITIPNSVTSIEGSAFENCDSLEVIDIPDSVTEIGASLFYGCNRLYKVILGDGITTIKDNMFTNCENLSSITLGKNITFIEDYSFFSGCDRIVEVINHSKLSIYAGSTGNQGIAAHAMEVHNGESKLVKKGDYLFYIKSYITLVGYLGNDEYLVLPDNFNGDDYSIGSYAFAYRKDIKGVELSKNVQHISDHAFISCSNLEYVNIPDDYFGLESIGEWAFAYCKSLKEIIIPRSCNNIYDLAFDSCDSLKKIEILGGTDWYQVVVIGGKEYAYKIDLSSPSRNIEYFVTEGSWEAYSRYFYGTVLKK